MVKKLLIHITEEDGGIDKLVKLVPADAIAAYLTFINLGNPLKEGSTWVYPNAWLYPFGSMIIGLIVLFIVRILGKTDQGRFAVDLNKVDVVLLIISIAAFFIWVYSIGGSDNGPLSPIYNAWLAGAMVFLMTLGAPYLHKGGTRLLKKSSSIKG